MLINRQLSRIAITITEHPLEKIRDYVFVKSTGSIQRQQFHLAKFARMALALQRNCPVFEPRSIV